LVNARSAEGSAPLIGRRHKSIHHPTHFGSADPFWTQSCGNSLTSRLERRIRDVGRDDFGDICFSHIAHHAKLLRSPHRECLRGLFLCTELELFLVRKFGFQGVFVLLKRQHFVFISKTI